jgi:hypothetical protein
VRDVSWFRSHIVRPLPDSFGDRHSVGLTACGGVVTRVSCGPWLSVLLKRLPTLWGVADGAADPANDLPGGVARLRTDASPACARPPSRTRPHAVPDRRPGGPYPGLSRRAAVAPLGSLLSASLLAAGRVSPDRALARPATRPAARRQTKGNGPIRERYRHGAGVVTYLARALRGGPITNTRLVAWDGDRVTCTCRARPEAADSGRRPSQRLPLAGPDFRPRWLLPVPVPQTRVGRSSGL